VKTFGIAPKRAGLTLAVLATGLIVAACGSSSSTTTTKSASLPSTSAGSSTSRTAFRTCLKQHGVTLPNFRRRGTTGPGGGPPPGAGGGFFGGGGAGQFANPKFRAAFQACGGSRGGFRPGGTRRFQLSHTAVNNFVACVRKHGYPQMPNPNFSGGAIFPSSIRTNAKFRAASKSCTSLLVPARQGTGQTGPGA
jgi:hypothetical protein